MAPEGENARIALLTPGPYNETYFEHAYLARYLGLTLVEGNDLTVRDQRLYLKTLSGLEPVHGLIKRLDDELLDPLELRSDSTPGRARPAAGDARRQRAAGQRARLGARSSPAPCSAFCPRISRHLLGEELRLPSLATWWCGEDAAAAARCCRSSNDCVDQTDLPALGPGHRRCGQSAEPSASSTNGPAASRATATTTRCSPSCRCRRCPPGPG